LIIGSYECRKVNKGVKVNENDIIINIDPDTHFESTVCTTRVIDIKSWDETPENQERTNNIAGLRLNTAGPTD